MEIFLDRVRMTDEIYVDETTKDALCQEEKAFFERTSDSMVLGFGRGEIFQYLEVYPPT